jgi:hypothetical protein
LERVRPFIDEVNVKHNEDKVGIEVFPDRIDPQKFELIHEQIRNPLEDDGATCKGLPLGLPNW